METRTLRWFQQVADGVTLTEISDLEMVSQPAVSRALDRLEEEVGAPLLRRAGRVLRLTRAGVAFKRHVDAMMHSLDDGIAAVEQLLDPETGTVTLAFQPSLGTWLVPDLVGSFGARHPEVRFDLHSKSDERLPGVGSSSEVDLELSTISPQGSEQEWLDIVEEPLRLLVPAAHRLAAAGAVSLADLADETFVMIRPASLLRIQTDDLCRRVGFEPRFALEGDDLPTTRGYVAAGLGIAVVPALWDTAAEPRTSRVRYLALTDEGASRTVRMVWARGRRLLPTATLFRTHVVERARAGRLPVPVPVDA